MGKFYSRIFGTLFLLLSYGSAFSQVNTYSFSQTAGSYTPITGGTQVAKATATTGANALDDVIYTSIPLPFNFAFNGIEYNTVTINSNGYITFGGTMPATNLYTPISSTTGYAGAIAALANDHRGIYATSATRTSGSNTLTSVTNTGGISVGDVVSMTGIPSGTTVTAVGANTVTLSANATSSGTSTLTVLSGEIRYETLGAAPNRTFVIQWKGFQLFATSNSSLNFQIRLNEGGGLPAGQTIEVVYGNFLPTSSTIQVGLRGAANTDFNNRTTTTNWAATTAGATNGATMTLSSTVFPASGQTYVWTPNVPALDLSLVSISGMPATPCPNNSVPVSVTIKNSGSGPIDFSTNNATVTVNVSGASTQSLSVTLNNGSLAVGASMTIPVFPNANLTAGGVHNFNGTLSFSGDGVAGNNTASASATIAFSTSLPASVNFTGFTGGNLTTLFPGWIEGSGTSTPGGTTSSWTSFTGLGDASNVTAKINLFSNSKNDWIVSPGFMATANTVLQYDVALTSFNSATTPDVMGSDDRVSVMVSTDCGLNWTEVKAYTVADNLGITLLPQLVNLSAYAGQNIMVAFKASEGTVNDAPDYDFHIDNILIGDACSGTPTGGTTNATQTTVCLGGSSTLSVSGASNTAGIGYQWQSSTDGVNFTDITGATGATYLATGISAATYYRVKVTCSNGGAFDYSAPVQITTSAPATVPLLEDFESLTTVGEGIMPGCWSTQLITGTNFTSADAPVRNGLGARSGTDYVWSRWSSDAWLFSPAVQLTAGVSYDFSFYYRQTDAVTGFTLTAAYGSSNTAAAMTNVLGTITDPINTTYTQVKYTFTPAASGVYYFGLRSNSPTSSPWYMTFDDFAIEPTPPCVAPNTVTISSITNTGATVNFNATGTSYIVEYGPSGFTPGTGATAGTGGTLVNSAASPVTLTGLTGNTTYQVYVRQVCGAAYSVNSNVVSFTSLCDPTNLPYTENFDAVTTPAIPQCTQVQDLNGGNTWTTIAAPTGYTGNTLRYNWHATLPGNDWFFTRGLNLTSGTVYRLVYRYGNNSTSFTEKLKVSYGMASDAAAMTNLLIDHPAINDNTPHQDTIYFTPTATGVYYIGFHAYSNADEFSLYLDDISVIKAPLVDVSPVGIITPPTTCPINLVTVQATVKNMTSFPLDLSVNPVTVTANITGAGTATLSAVLNSGTLAPGATTDVALSPTFNFNTGGTYNIAVTTTQAADEEATNNSYNTSVFVNTPPAAPTLTPAAPAVCASGGTVQITASGSNFTGSATIGTGTATNNTVTPYKGWWGGHKAQYLYKASELQAQGLTAGSSITSVSFRINSFSSPFTFNDFSIAMKNTSTATLTTTLETGTTTVLAPSSFVLSGTAPFTVTHTLTTPFVWDGTSNLLIETCFNNNNSGGSSSNSAEVLTSTVTGSVVYYTADNTANVCTSPGTGTTSSARPNVVLGHTTPAAYTWSPAAGLFTDAAGTVAYTGQPAATVYAKPSSATNYTVTATSGFGCTSTSTVNVGLSQPIVIHTQPQAQTVCSAGSVTLYVVAANAASYQWMKDGNIIPGATNASLTISNFSAADAGIYEVAVMGNAPCDSLHSAEVNVSFAPVNTWMGTSNSDWNNPLNWCGGVPTPTSDVTVPAGTVFAPVLTGNSEVRNLTIANGATVTVNNSGRLLLYGHLVNNGTFNATAGTIEFRGAANQNVPAISAANIIMNGAGGITLGGDMNIGTALTLTNGNITLGSHNLQVNGGAMGSVSSHIVTNGTGRVTSNNINAVSVVFPVGPTASSYNPVVIANGQGRNYSVGVATGLPATPPVANAARAVNRTWNITANTAPTSPVYISLQYADADVNASATPTANMEAGVQGTNNWLTVSPAGGVVPAGTAGGRTVSFQTISLGTTVLANIGGVNFPTAVPNVDADVTSVQMMPNAVDNNTLVRVKTRRTTKIEWTVIDGNGRVVMAFSKQVFAGQNDIQLSLGQLASGSYQLVGKTDKGAVETVRFVRL